ncbi:MAG: YolA family protein [Proteobacteria bacterium]|nr:YolA family protein [Pseudomonadota bacterium]MBU4010153.1 YolA family protein [Pseudomonadota bacterium]
MRKKLFYFGFSVLFVMLVSLSVHAIEFNHIQNDGINLDARSKICLENNADLIEKMGVKIKEYMAKQGVSIEGIDNTDKVATASSAPPVSLLQFTGVISQYYSTWEDIGTYQTITVYDHGGTYMYLEVLEIGYGYDYAWMSGAQLSEVAKYNVVSGGIVVGFVHYYDASGYQGGYATTSATSINYPYNTMSDALTVQ